MFQWLLPLLQNLGFRVYDAPTPIYEDIQPTIDIIKANHITGIVKHIYFPINYLHEQYFLLTIDHVKLKTTIHPADICNKSSTVPLLKRH